MAQHVPKINSRLVKAYVSVVVFVQRGQLASTDIVSQAIRAYVEKDAQSTLVADGLSQIPRDLSTRTTIKMALSFATRRQPPWGGLSTDAGHPEFSNRENHLVLVLESADLIAVHTTDSRIKEHLLRLQGKLKLGGVGLLNRPALEEALLKGEIATFWMGEGAPGRGRRGPRSKTTYGERLEETIDAVGDQRHTLAGARASVGEDLLGPGREGVVGTNLEGSSFWLSRSSNLTDFVDTTDRFLEALHRVLDGGGGHERFVIFARYVDNLDAVEKAYDISFSVPGVQPGISPESEAVDAYDLVQNRIVAIEPSGTRSARVTLAGDNGTSATLVVKPERESGGSITFAASPAEGDDRLGAEFRDALLELDTRVYYESGHTVSRQGVVAEHLTDVPFGGWVFDPLAGIDEKREKPGDGSRSTIWKLGGDSSDESLFGWVIRECTTGWLYCDDGSDELCDFVHLDTLSDQLTIWHVKACKSGSSRKVAAVPYEQVCAQVEKNLPSLAVPRLVEELEQRVNLKDYGPVWHDGVITTNLQGMIASLREPRANLRVAVRILQPHVTEEHLKVARASSSGGSLHGEQQRIRRLDHLLLSTDDAVSRLGAHLEVVTKGA